MNILVVYCHPSEESFCAKLAQACVRKLEADGHTVVFRDLYKERFDPVLSEAEFSQYHTALVGSSKIGAYCGDLAKVEGILFVYPTWWYGMPATMKGYLDRVWLPGVAFEIDSSGSISTNALRHVNRFMVVTTYGSPKWWILLWLNNPARKAVERGLGRLFAPGCKKAWLRCMTWTGIASATARCFF